MKMTVMMALLFFGIQDIKEKKISLIPLCALIVASFLYYFWKVYRGQENLTSMMWNLLPGLFVLGMGLWNRKKVGMGDGLILLFLGNCIGYEGTIWVLFLALLAACVLSVALLLLKKVRMDSAIPFIPFVCVGFASYCLLCNG